MSKYLNSMIMKGYIANPTTKKHHNMLRFTSSLEGTNA
jgi:hypothetical protein